MRPCAPCTHACSIVFQKRAKKEREKERKAAKKAEEAAAAQKKVEQEQRCAGEERLEVGIAQ